MNNSNNFGVAASGGGGGAARKRSRTNSNTSSATPRSCSTPNNNHHNITTTNSNFILDKNERLLRLNVGGYPYDVVRTSLPLLETMMTDRWLSSCLVDSDGRIFIDRDGDAFGDILRYLRGGSDFLLELVHSSNAGGANNNNNNNAGGYAGGGLGTVAMRAGLHGTSGISKNNMDRLRRLRTEADYYGLHHLVHDIDVVTIGRKIVFENASWARVAGGCLPRNQRRQQMNQNNGNENENGNNNNRNDNGRNGNADGGQNGADNNNVDVAVDNGNNDNEQQEEQLEEEGEDNANDNDNDEDQVMNDDENNDDEEDDVEDEDDEDVQDDDDDEIPDQDDDEPDDGDPNQPPPYKFWSWSNQYGNPDILRPHPTHTSSMVVGQDGSYLLLLRLAAALPSPLARIKWDQEEEEGRRVTRGAVRRSSRRRRPSDRDRDSEEEEEEAYNEMNRVNNSANNNSNSNSNPHHGDNRSKELEEDYFVTLNIEAPLQTVMDSVDESQTHFPLLRAGLWDYRTEDEVQNDDPVFATFCAMDVVSLRAGDVLSVSFMNDEVSRERCPFPDETPPELVNSLTLVKVCGNTMARYERLKSSPTSVVQAGLMDHTQRKRGSLNNNAGGTGTDSSDDAAGTQHQNQLDYEAAETEEFDRSLTRTAHWNSPRNDFSPTPFQPPLHSHSSVMEFPHAGHYLLLGRVALGCRRDATFHSVLSGGPIEGHRAQLSLRSAGGRLLHAVGFVFEDKPRLEWADLSILSENAMFNDVVHVPRAGTELSITTTGDCRLHPEGTEVGPFCSAVSQSLSCLLLDDDIMEVDRYMVGTVRNASLNQREVKWFHTRSASAPTGQGKGGTHSKPSLFDIDGHRLVWRGCLNNSNNFLSMNGGGNNDRSTTVLIVGSIPPLHRGYVVSLLKNNDPISISITPESLDMKGRHCHYFQEVVELTDGDEIAIAQCAFDGEEGSTSWRDQLHVENRLVEFDTRIGHLSFVVLQSGGGAGGGSLGDEVL